MLKMTKDGGPGAAAGGGTILEMMLNKASAPGGAAAPADQKKIDNAPVGLSGLIAKNNKSAKGDDV